MPEISISHWGVFMNNETKHTPTPWHISDSEALNNIVYRHDGYAICDTKVFHGKINNEEAKANAAFIVRACNSHDMLVYNLEKLVCALERNEYLFVNFAPPEYIQMIRATLAKSKEGAK